jgi:hypothetical protein
MPEPRRLGSAPGFEAVDRDSQTEALLVDGLDRYVEGRYEEAIHVWTRVLFLDRTHARARAYIDRARTALAERHRQADEKLHETGESIARGDADGARRLLSEAVEAAGGDDERAAGLRLHLERLERVRTPPASTSYQARVVDAVPVTAGQRWFGRSLIAGTAMAAVVALVVVSAGPVRDWLILRRATPTLDTGRAAEPGMPPSASEVAFIRARALFARGRLAEALRALDRVGPDSRERAAADAMRLEIQGTLLATVPRPSTAPMKAGQP